MQIIFLLHIISYLRIFIFADTAPITTQHVMSIVVFVTHFFPYTLIIIH